MDIQLSLEAEVVIDLPVLDALDEPQLQHCLKIVLQPHVDGRQITNCCNVDPAFDIPRVTIVGLLLPALDSALNKCLAERAAHRQKEIDIVIVPGLLTELPKRVISNDGPHAMCDEQHWPP